VQALDGQQWCAVAVDQDAFGQFHHQVRWLQAVACQGLGHDRRQLQVVEAGRREVDGHRRDGQAFAAPLRQLPAGLVQRPAAQRRHQAAFFGQRDEAGGWNQAQDRMPPAREGFQAMQASAGQFDLRLVMQLQAPGLQGGAQCLLQRQTFLRGPAQFHAEETDPPGAAGLGLVQGHPGAVQQAADGRAVLRIHGHAHADAQVDPGAGQLQRPRQLRLPAFDQDIDLLAGPQGQGEDEFVARQAAGHAALVHQFPHARGHFAQQGVARGPAQRIVDVLETVQVHVQDRDALAGSPRRVQQLPDLGFQKAAVRQAGERVVVRQLPDPLACQLAFHSQCAQVGAGLHQLLVEAGCHEGAVLAVVKGEGSQAPCRSSAGSASTSRH